MKILIALGLITVLVACDDVYPTNSSYEPVYLSEPQMRCYRTSMPNYTTLYDPIGKPHRVIYGQQSTVNCVIQ